LKHCQSKTETVDHLNTCFSCLPLHEIWEVMTPPVGCLKGNWTEEASQALFIWMEKKEKKRAIFFYLILIMFVKTTKMFESCGKHDPKSVSAAILCSVQFSSRWYLCAQKTHMRSTPSPRSFPNIAFETVPMFIWLTMALSCLLKKDSLVLPLPLWSAACISNVIKKAVMRGKSTKICHERTFFCSSSKKSESTWLPEWAQICGKRSKLIKGLKDN